MMMMKLCDFEIETLTTNYYYIYNNIYTQVEGACRALNSFYCLCLFNNKNKEALIIIS